MSRSKSRKKAAPARGAAVSLPVFAVSASVLVALATLAEKAAGLDAIRRVTTDVSYRIVTALGMHTTEVGLSIVTRSRTLDVAAECIPLAVFAVMVAVILATKTLWSMRAIGVVVGALSMFVANVVRVVVGVVIAQAVPAWFDLLHTTALQLVAPTVAIGTWLVWTRYARED